MQRMQALFCTAEGNRAMKARDSEVRSLETATFLSADLRASSVVAAIESSQPMSACLGWSDYQYLIS
jgi:hypothetical protein